MIERRCRVVRIDQSCVLLQAEPGSCNGCLGCAGHCSLLPRGNSEVSIALADIDGQLRENEWVSLTMHESALRNEALRGYGLPLAGMLSGAVLGNFFASPLGLPTDLATAIASSAGTLLGLNLSKRGAKAVLRVRPESPSN